MEFETEFAGRKLIVKVGKLANQANGSCIVQYGETTVLATVTIAPEEKEGIDFLPLTVEYEEKFYAAGKIKGSRFIKRETRPTDEAILAARAIDRSIRPLFDKKIRQEIQVILTVLSIDQKNDPEIVGLYAASLALAISDIPWDGPIAAVRIGRIGSEFVLNSTVEARKRSSLDLLVSGRRDHILMIEAGANEINEEITSEAVRFANKHISKLVNFFQEIQERVGKQKDKSIINKLKEPEEEYKKIVKEFIDANVDKYLFSKPLKTKADRIGAVEKIKKDLEEILKEKNIGKEKREKALEVVDDFIHQKISQAILDKNLRIDGRKLDEIRPINCFAGVLPRVHGSAIFQRGETQVLSVVTLAGPSMEQYLDTMEETGRKRFMHHYNFPPYCSGEVKPIKPISRRSIGHGALVERGLQPVIPDKESFPYTIRVVSEVMSSNGSTSMASACASSLALMDSGVKIKTPVAGIAIGLASEEENDEIKRYKIFTDLQDLEDGPGGMDFKVIGTKEGITAIQMDTKTHGLTPEIVAEALEAAKKARLEILEKMAQCLPEPRPSLSPYAPRVTSFRINPEKIRDVIGPGGKVINDIISKTGVTIDIEHDGFVVITGESDDAIKKASEWVKNLAREIKIGEVFQAKITRILDFGAFAEILPGHEGLIHISELTSRRIKHPTDVVDVGDVVPVKVIGIDSEGRINLSMRAVTEKGYRPRVKRVRRRVKRVKTFPQKRY